MDLADIFKDACVLFLAHKGEHFFRWILPILLLFIIQKSSDLCEWIIEVSISTPELYTDFEDNLALQVLALEIQGKTELEVNFKIMLERYRYAKGAVYESLINFFCRPPSW